MTLYRIPLRRSRGGFLRYVLDYASFFVVAALLTLYLTLRRRYRVVQVTTMPDFLVFASFPARLFGAKVLGFFKEPSPELTTLLFNHALLVKLMTNVEQRALRFVDYAITVTPQLRDLYVERGANPERLAVVLNATDPPWGSPSNDVPTDGAFVLFTHGTVEERYGHDTVVQAVALAAPRVPGLQFWFTGDGRYVAPVLDLARRLGVADRVHYRGFLPLGEVGALLHAAGATVVAQKASSYSHLVHTCKLFEYVQASKPVIASRLRATEACFGPDAVRYFEPGDPGSLAEAIVETYRNERLRASLVEGAQMLHAKYGWHRHRRTYVDLVDRLVAE